jgi:ADP-heptose:LPS heptosyltransferase
LPHLIDHSTGLADFADTAAVVELMDLIVSVDTALAHLGGALAKPTWTMLPFGAEYRWLTAGTTSAWYPTMRLFRQPELFGWPQVVEAIGSALSANTVFA